MKPKIVILLFAISLSIQPVKAVQVGGPGSSNGAKMVSLEVTGQLRITGETFVQAYLNGAQSIATYWNVVNLDTEQADSLNEFNTTTHQFTATKAGLYLLIGNVGFSAATNTGDRCVGLRKNGATWLATSYTRNSGTGITVAVNTVVVTTMEAGDYVELMAYWTSAGTIALTPYSSYTYLHIARLQ